MDAQHATGGALQRYADQPFVIVKYFLCQVVLLAGNASISELNVDLLNVTVQLTAQ